MGKTVIIIAKVIEVSPLHVAVTAMSLCFMLAFCFFVIHLYMSLCDVYVCGNACLHVCACSVRVCVFW